MIVSPKRLPEVVIEQAEQLGFCLDKTEAHFLLLRIFGFIANEVKKGNTVDISGFGRFLVCLRSQGERKFKTAYFKPAKGFSKVIHEEFNEN